MFLEQKYETLMEARSALQGSANSAKKSKNDNSVISFSNGDGVRWPDYLAGYSFPFKDIHKYDFLRRDDELSSLMLNYCGFSLSTQHLVFTLGVSDGIQTYLRCCATENDCILVTTGHYHSIASWAHFTNIPLKLLMTSNLKSKDNIDSIIPNIRKICKQYARVHLILTSPTISGDILPSEFTKALRSASLSNFYLIHDCVFYNTSKRSALEIDSGRTYNNEIKFFSLTKTHGLGGHPFGAGIGDPALIKIISDYLAGHRGRYSRVTSEIAMLALKTGNNYVTINNQEIATRRNWLIKKIAEHANLIELVNQPCASHSICFKFKRPYTGDRVFSSESIQHTFNLINNFDVALSPGITNGEVDGSLRLNFADVGNESHSEMDLESAFGIGRKTIEKGLTRILEYAKTMDNY